MPGYQRHEEETRMAHAAAASRQPPRACCRSLRGGEEIPAGPSDAAEYSLPAWLVVALPSPPSRPNRRAYKGTFANQGGAAEESGQPPRGGRLPYLAACRDDARGVTGAKDGGKRVPAGAAGCACKASALARRTAADGTRQRTCHLVRSAPFSTFRLRAHDPYRTRPPGRPERLNQPRRLCRHGAE